MHLPPWYLWLLFTCAKFSPIKTVNLETLRGCELVNKFEILHMKIENSFLSFVPILNEKMLLSSVTGKKLLLCFLHRFAFRAKTIFGEYFPREFSKPNIWVSVSVFSRRSVLCDIWNRKNHLFPIVLDYKHLKRCFYAAFMVGRIFFLTFVLDYVWEGFQSAPILTSTVTTSFCLA